MVVSLLFELSEECVVDWGEGRECAGTWECCRERGSSMLDLPMDTRRGEAKRGRPYRTVARRMASRTQGSNNTSDYDNT